MKNYKNNVGADASVRPSSKARQNKGITLIALVITIIVMLILVAVTISMAINGGLFQKAGEAVGDTQNAIDEEQTLASGQVTIDGEVYNTIDEYLNGETTEEPVLKVGDYVNYTPVAGTYKVADGTNGTGYTTTDGYQEFTTEDLGWRVLSIDGTTGKIELISSKATGTALYLSGANGYNHGVDILNDLCEALYSNSNGITGRSINVDDINAKTTFDYTKYTNYGKTYSFVNDGWSYCPSLYYDEENGLGESDGKNDGSTDEENITSYSLKTGYSNAYTSHYYGSKTIVAVWTDYSYKLNDYYADLGVDTAPEDLLLSDTDYWLASRSVTTPSPVGFQMRSVSCSSTGADSVECKVGSLALFSSYQGLAFESSAKIRPVVSLGSNATLTLDTENSTDTVTYWNIEF